MPAVAKFHVPHLSLDHGGRLFRVKLEEVHAQGQRCAVPQVVYSQPFEVVSKLDVVKKAAKRRTSEQVREDARKRARPRCQDARLS